MPPKLLPASPHLVHLKKQAKVELPRFSGRFISCAHMILSPEPFSVRQA